MASEGQPRGELGRGRPLEEGAQFASYVIVGLLGSGGLARVYRARHQTLGHEVALKIFEPAAAPGPSGVARFLREAHLAASVHHPHVVQTQDAGVHDGLPFVVMELLEGRDLETYLRAEHTLEELALIEVAIPIVAALMALHAQGLVHGDLGPGNLFLATTPQRAALPKLLDIGISKPHRQLRLTAAARQRLMGSPLYMAPEAMLGHELTPASDQYSLGLILYEAVTGVNPFIATSLKESVRLIIAGQRLAVLEQSVAPSPGLADIIERTLSVDPADRFPDLASLGRALLRLADQRTRAEWEFSFQTESTATAVASAVKGASSAPSAPSRWGALGVAVAVLGWVTAGIVSYSASRSDPAQAYVLVGPGAGTADPPRRSEPAITSTTLALAPCPEVHSSDVAAAGATGEGRPPSSGELDVSQLPGEVIEGEGGAGALGAELAVAGASAQPLVVGSTANADPALGALPGSPQLGSPVPGSPVPGSPQLGSPQLGSPVPGSALPDVMPLDLPVETPPGVIPPWGAQSLTDGMAGAGARLPSRGTNNAPIFD